MVVFGNASVVALGHFALRLCVLWILFYPYSLPFFHGAAVILVNLGSCPHSSPLEVLSVVLWLVIFMLCVTLFGFASIYFLSFRLVEEDVRKALECDDGAVIVPRNLLVVESRV